MFRGGRFSALFIFFLPRAVLKQFMVIYVTFLLLGCVLIHYTLRNNFLLRVYPGQYSAQGRQVLCFVFIPPTTSRPETIAHMVKDLSWNMDWSSQCMWGKNYKILLKNRRKLQIFSITTPSCRLSCEQHVNWFLGKFPPISRKGHLKWDIWCPWEVLFLVRSW